MNKRFSTLLAAALVAGGVSANAATENVLLKAKTGDYVTILDPDNDNLCIEYWTDGHGLSTNDGEIDFANASLKEAFLSMWQVTVTPGTGTAGVRTYKFVNRYTKEALAIDLLTNGKDGVSTTPLTLDKFGNEEWAWMEGLGFYASEGDSTFYIRKHATYGGVLAAVKGDVNDALVAAGTEACVMTPTAITNASRNLTADDFNTLVGETGKLYFNNGKDVAGVSSIAKDKNVLTAKAWFAQGVCGGQDQATATQLMLMVKGSNDKGANPSYLTVDTLTYDMAGESNVLKVDTMAEAPAFDQAGIINNWDKISSYSGALDEKTVGGKKSYKAVANAFNALFHGTYFFANDSIVLRADNKPTIVANTDGKPNTMGYTTYCDPKDAIGYAGQIVLRKMDDHIVLTPVALGHTVKDETDAKTHNYILPLIQPAALTAAEVDKNFTSVKDSVYFIKNAQGQYLADPIYEAQNDYDADTKWVSVKANEQNVAHMPAFQWVVLKDRATGKAAATSPVTVYNREFDKVADKKMTGIQLQKTLEEGWYKFEGIKNALKVDSIQVIGIPAEAMKDSTMGYKVLAENDLMVNRYTFNYLHGYANDKFIGQSTEDSTATVFDDKGRFVIKIVNQKAADREYGFKVTDEIQKRIPTLEQLERYAYTVSVPGGKNLGFDKTTENKFVISKYVNATSFYFKENNDLGENKCYHALVVVPGEGEDYAKAGTTDDDLSATLKHQVWSETRTSAFLIAQDNAPLYRRFNSAELEGAGAVDNDEADTLRFVEKYKNLMLQVESDDDFTKDGIKFLGAESASFTKDGKSFIVDTAFVNRWNGRIKPQYLISINREDKPFKAGERCPICQKYYEENGKWPTGECIHDEEGKLGFHFGEYLVNFKDSVKTHKHTEYAWKGYTRAGFVKAAHQGDSLYILTGQFADWTVADFNAETIKKAVKEKKYSNEYIVSLVGDGKADSKNADNHKTVTWSMRFVNPEAAAEEDEESRAFLMESLAATNQPNIAPQQGSWLKLQNGCIVLSGSQDNNDSSFEEVTGDDDALIFTVEKGSKEDLATDNETIATSEVTVIAGEGQVTIANAAGKKVVISNILGQTVANTVLTSDNATIVAPQGVVVVAVEGEEAVKAIVK